MITVSRLHNARFRIASMENYKTYKGGSIDEFLNQLIFREILDFFH